MPDKLRPETTPSPRAAATPARGSGAARLVSVALAAAAAAGSAAAAPHGSHGGGQASGAAPAQRSWIYYDYVEEGELRGGRIAVDPRNPLHAHVPTPPGGGVAGAPNVVTLVESGPVENRVDLVLLGDGYTADELDDFAAHVDQVLPTFLAEAPFADYDTFFNVHRVDVVSNESGVDNDPTLGVLKDTALDMEYWCGGTERLLCVNVAKANVHAGHAPDSDQVLVLANSTKYGGAGYSSAEMATLAGDNFSSIEIALHELGHSLGDLADEYTYGGPDVFEGPEPSSANLSKKDAAQMANQLAKWHLWLADGNVSTFEGGGYSNFGIYRPTNNSKMRNLGRPFEQVNAEQLVVEMYKIVRPIDGASPPGVYGAGDVLFVDPVDPAAHALDVQWTLDGEPLPGETGTELDVSALGLADGLWTVAAVVSDPTPYVRDPALRDEWLTETREWTVVIGEDPPPVVTAASAVFSYQTLSTSVEGLFLDSVTGARIDGVPAQLVEQDFDSLKVKPTAPGTPGWAELELDWTSGTAVFPGALKQYPTLEASTSGVGGELNAAVEIAEFQNGTAVLLYSLGAVAQPLEVPGIHYGLFLDPAPSLVTLHVASGVTGTSVSLPVPDNPALAGLALHLQAWTQKGYVLLVVPSFTNLVSLTL